MNGLTKPRDFGDGCPLTNERYVWSCAIGGLKPVPVPSGGDAPMRRAVERAFLELTGHEAQACFSGWGEEFAEPARAVIENRIPVEEEKSVRADIQSAELATALDQLAAAKAVAALVVSELRQFVTDSYQCGCMDAGCAGRHAERNSTLEALSETLDALAPADGLAAVEALRVEARENAMQALASMGQAQEAYEAQLEAEAERDRLVAENAALEAKVAGLVAALKPFCFFSDEPNTTQEAWEIRYCDRFKDWIDFADIESARAALAQQPPASGDDGRG